MVEISKRRWLFTWNIVDPPGSHAIFSVLVALSLLLDSVPRNIEDGTDGACNVGDALAFSRILLGVTFIMIGLAGVVSFQASFKKDMMYALAWSSVGALGGGFSLGGLDRCL